MVIVLHIGIVLSEYSVTQFQKVEIAIDINKTKGIHNHRLYPPPPINATLGHAGSLVASHVTHSPPPPPPSNLGSGFSRRIEYYDFGKHH